MKLQGSRYWARANHAELNFSLRLSSARDCFPSCAQLAQLPHTNLGPRGFSGSPQIRLAGRKVPPFLWKVPFCVYKKDRTDRSRTHTQEVMATRPRMCGVYGQRPLRGGLSVLMAGLPCAIARRGAPRRGVRSLLLVEVASCRAARAALAGLVVVAAVFFAQILVVRSGALCLGARCRTRASCLCFVV